MDCFNIQKRIHSPPAILRIRILSLRINPQTLVESIGKAHLRRKLFVKAGYMRCGKQLGSAVSVCFPEKTGAIGCWIYKKEGSLS